VKFEYVSLLRSAWESFNASETFFGARFSNPCTLGYALAPSREAGSVGESLVGTWPSWFAVCSSLLLLILSISWVDGESTHLRALFGFFSCGLRALFDFDF
jgi:hypothetical protein